MVLLTASLRVVPVFAQLVAPAVMVSPAASVVFAGSAAFAESVVFAGSAVPSLRKEALLQHESIVRLPHQNDIPLLASP